ncbi:MAG: NUDIX domain-containing protein [Candidatus Nomurabacteria bacterium]|jgi:ADP-ribose pyrophosphatase YjhB (NUDIX family)|nr:NUDIX domain-containing protein [Candidatus Nomurabacteria bacterium]
MKVKVLNIAVVEKNGAVLMRKKPDGSPPYSETWYLFGGEVADGISPEEATKEIVKKQTGADIELRENIGWDTEIKNDLDGERKQFIYLDSIWDHTGGDLVAGEGIEKVEFVPIEKLGDYDIVPPSRTLFEKLGYIKKETS